MLYFLGWKRRKTAWCFSNGNKRQGRRMLVFFCQQLLWQYRECEVRAEWWELKVLSSRIPQSSAVLRTVNALLKGDAQPVVCMLIQEADDEEYETLLRNLKCALIGQIGYGGMPSTAVTSLFDYGLAAIIAKKNTFRTAQGTRNRIEQKRTFIDRCTDAFVYICHRRNCACAISVWAGVSAPPYVSRSGASILRWIDKGVSLVSTNPLNFACGVLAISDVCVTQHTDNLFTQNNPLLRLEKYHIWRL